MPRGTRWGRWWCWGLLVVLAAGCGARTEYEVHRLTVEQAGWDTLHVAVGFAQRTSLGGTRAALPDTASIYLYGSAYDTLYAGRDTVIAVPDRLLGNEERLVLEVCGTFGTLRVCEQEGLRASPKRLRVDADISYPDDLERSLGRYTFSFEAERQRWDSDAWDRVELDGVPEGYLQAYIGTDQQAAVRIPLRGTSGRFDLSRLAGYDDFKFALDSRLFDQEDAVVTFEVHAGLGGEVEPIASMRRTITAKTRADRVTDVAAFVRQAVPLVAEALGTYWGRDRAYAYVDDWRYNKLKDVYEIEVEMRWRGRSFRERLYQLRGTLRVREDGSQPVFVRRDANGAVRRRWYASISGNTLELGPMVSAKELARRDSLDALRRPDASDDRFMDRGDPF